MNLRPSGYEGDAQPKDDADLSPLAGRSLVKLAEKYLKAVHAGDVHAHDRGIELAGAVLAAAAVARADDDDDDAEGGAAAAGNGGAA